MFQGPKGYTAKYVKYTCSIETVDMLCKFSYMKTNVFSVSLNESIDAWTLLLGRKQFTSIRGVDSSLKEISCSVPQGLILGPILFLILINDLPKASKFFTS